MGIRPVSSFGNLNGLRTGPQPEESGEASSIQQPDGAALRHQRSTPAADFSDGSPLNPGRPAAGGIFLPVLHSAAGLFRTAANLGGRRCHSCGAPLKPGEISLCGQCAEALAPRTGGYCPGCGRCYREDISLPHLCANCLTSPKPWDGIVFHGVYDDRLRDLILQFKFHSRLGLSDLLGSLLTQAYLRSRRDPPDCVVPVPLHPERLRKRGYNQGLELARPVATALGSPLLSGALHRPRPTAPQMSLSARQRAENVRNAFIADEEGSENRQLLRGKTVLLVDDIMTTGATLEACSHALLNAGAAGVTGLVLARAAD